MLLLLCLGVGQMWAWEERTYDGSTKLYISNIKPNGWSDGLWASDDNNRMFVYLEYNNSGGSYWMEATLEASSNGKYNKGALYSVTPTSGTYKYFKIARGSNSSSISNETSKCQFVSGGGNFITHYKEGNGDSQITWGSIDPRPITSDGSGVLYFDIDPSGCSWWKNDGGDYKFAYFFNDESGAWSNHSDQVSGDYYKVNVPEGTWKGVILTRQKVTSSPTWIGDNGVNNQTADIPFNHGNNYLSNFVPNNFDYILSWSDYIPIGTTLLNGTMNNWELITAKAFTEGELKITLPARKTMAFKIVEGNNGTGTWYGLTDANCILSDMTDWGFSSSGTNTRINTAGQGTYTFAYNASHQLSVTYPEVTHPNADYVYLIKYGWSSWRIHFDQSSTTYGIAKTTWTGQELTVASGTITDTYDYTAPGALSAQTYFYYAVGDYPKFNFNDNSSSNQTNDQAPSPGQYMYHDGTWKWGDFQFGVTLYTNGGTINTGNITSYTFGTGATLPTNVTRPGYYFAGWYAKSDFTGGRVYSISTTENTNKTYYAKWELQWTIAGTWGATAWDKDAYPLNNVTTEDDGETYTCYIDIDLAANTNYSFKVISRGDGARYWWQALTAAQTITYESGSKITNAFDAQVATTRDKSCTITTAGAGSYRFTFNITNKTVTIGYPESHKVTAVADPASSGIVTPSTATYMSESEGGPITATPYFGYDFTDWEVDDEDGTFDDDDELSTTFTPTADATVTAKFIPRYAYLEGRIQVRNENRATTYPVGKDGWGTSSRNIPMEYDETNHRYFLHTYSTPAELNVPLKSGDLNYIFVNTCTNTTGAFENARPYYSSVSYPDNVLSAKGYDNKVAVSTSGSGGLRITGTEDAFVIIYFDGEHIWYELEPTFVGGVTDHETEWNNTDNWLNGALPTINDPAYINAPVTVNTTEAIARRVVIYNDGDSHTGKLTIAPGQKMIVAETIKKTTDGSTYSTTAAEDLVFNSNSSNGVGALVWGTTGTTPGAAQVNFYSISGGSKNSTTSVNQLIGTPFVNGEGDWLYHYYNSWVLGVDYSSTTPQFYLLKSNEAMEPFMGYCVIYNGSAGHTYDMTGTLVDNANQTLNLNKYEFASASPTDFNENLFANSWLAPIKVTTLIDALPSSAYAGVYVFQAASENSQSSSLGNYATYTSANTTAVIPAMQGFSLFTTSGTGSVTLNYENMVYTPAISGINPSPNLAPNRVITEEANKVRLFVNAGSGYGDMVYMWERSDFIDGYDRAWDGHKFAGEAEAPQLYAVSPDGNMAVNCVPNFEGTVIGFKAGTEDDAYTFSFEYDEDQTPLYLYDTDENTYTRVLAGNTYTFSTTDKIDHNRFILSYNAQQTPTGVETVDGKENSAVKFLEDGKLFILRGGRLYDVTGALVK